MNTWVMSNFEPMSRRVLLQSTVFGMLTAAIPSVVFARRNTAMIVDGSTADNVFHRYPSVDDKIVAEVVGVSHFNLERVKELVTHRPELARATWDWAFGDWETALGAASHVGRRDIAEFLMEHGARPDIFTYAMLGAFEAVKAMIASTPGIQTIAGPHGISLMQHAKTGLRVAEIPDQKASSEALIDYLEELGNADVLDTYGELNSSEKAKYLGDYRYGDGDTEGFSVRLNRRDMISLGKLGAFGGALYQIGDNRFVYNGVTSVEITFQMANGHVISLTVHEPDLVLTAMKV